MNNVAISVPRYYLCTIPECMAGKKRLSVIKRESEPITMPGHPVKSKKITNLCQEQTPGPILATTAVPTVSCYEVREDPMVPVRAINMTDAVATHPTMQDSQILGF